MHLSYVVVALALALLHRIDARPRWIDGQLHEEASETRSPFWVSILDGTSVKRGIRRVFKPEEAAAAGGGDQPPPAASSSSSSSSRSSSSSGDGDDEEGDVDPAAAAAAEAVKEEIAALVQVRPPPPDDRLPPTSAFPSLTPPQSRPFPGGQ
jgi:hypothetical protein